MGGWAMHALNGSKLLAGRAWSSRVLMSAATMLGLLAAVLFAAVPAASAQGSATTTAYVTNMGGNTVSVIDTATGAVTGTIAVGTDPFAVAVNPTDTLA
jgi:YVTN family beta-propeller protein